MKNGKEYVIKFSKQAEKDKIKLKSSGLDKNCINILVLMKNDPFCYPLSYEKLSGDLSGLYSRRINRQHRIVYEVNEEDKEIHVRGGRASEGGGERGRASCRGGWGGRGGEGRGGGGEIL